MNIPAYMTPATARALIAESRKLRQRAAERKQARAEFAAAGWSHTASAELAEIHVNRKDAS